MRRPQSKLSDRNGSRPALPATGLLLGLALLRASEPLAQVAGGLLALAGGLPLLMMAGRTLQQWQRDREADFAAAKRIQRKAARKERTAAKLERQQQAQAVAQNADTLRTKQEAENERIARAQAEAEEAKRAERAARIEAEARRLKALPEEEYQAEAGSLLQKRGLNALPQSDNATGTRYAGAGRAALSLPLSNTANINDLERLNALRQKQKAAKGWLISRNGFAPDAVQALPNYPAITFADAYLLAEWSLSEQ